MNANDDIHFAYHVLARALCDKPYTQTAFWCLPSEFKTDPILGKPDFTVDGVPNQVRTGDEGTTIPSVSTTL